MNRPLVSAALSIVGALAIMCAIDLLIGFLFGQLVAIGCAGPLSIFVWGPVAKYRKVRAEQATSSVSS